MKKYFVVLLALLLLQNVVVVQSSLNMSKANFSSDIELKEYQWDIENYQVGDRRIETKSSPTSFEFIHGSRITLEVLKDPSELDLATYDNLSIIPEISDYFNLKYDDNSYDFDKADQLFIWVFPLSGINDGGDTIDLLEQFWIYNVHNLLLYGETLNFNSTLPDGEVSSTSNDGETTISLETDSVNLQAKVDSTTGLMNAINYVSTSPDFRIEVDRRGGGSGALPLSPFWIVLPLIAIPLVLRYKRNR